MIRLHRIPIVVASVLGVAGSFAVPGQSAAAGCGATTTKPATGTAIHLTNSHAVVSSGGCVKSAGAKGRNGQSAPRGTSDPYLYGATIACDEKDPDHSSGTACQAAALYCTYAVGVDSPGPHYYLWRKPRNPPGAAWQLYGETCSPRGKPGVPPVPSAAQLQSAFRALPFSRPRVHIQPEGNLTLVNLPTYYEAQWPGDAGLQPGEISKPVRLLSWSVRFRIDAHRYDFHFGDGQSTGPVTDAGGPYPTGSVTHVYTKANAATPVRVDAQLTGAYQVNGAGGWIPIDTVADLPNEPVTTLVVKTAKNRLYLD